MSAFPDGIQAKVPEKAERGDSPGQPGGPGRKASLPKVCVHCTEIKHFI